MWDLSLFLDSYLGAMPRDLVHCQDSHICTIRLSRLHPTPPWPLRFACCDVVAKRRQGAAGDWWIWRFTSILSLSSCPWLPACHIELRETLNP